MNKLKIKSLIISLLIIYNAYSQTTFEYLQASPLTEIVSDIYEDDSGYIFIIGSIDIQNEFGKLTQGLMTKIDRKGIFLDSIQMPIDHRNFYLVNILPDENNNYVLSGISCDTIEPAPFHNCKIELKKINSNLEVLTNKTFTFPPEYGYWNMLTRRGRNNDLLIGGTIFWSTYTLNIFFYTVDEHFDSIKARYYHNATRSCYGLHQVTDSLYWMIDGISSDYYTLDYNLNMTEYPYAVPHRNSAPYGIQWDSDTSFYLVGEWDDGPDDDIGFFRQFDPVDSTNNIFNSWGTLDTLDLPAWWDALSFNNKDSIFIGGATNISGNSYSPWPSWYFIIQTDSNLNVRWERFYGGDAHYVMRKIIASNDGGCIVAGTRYDYQNATEEELDIHILKLNNEGLIVNTREEPAIEMREALVFPNPGTNYLQVRIATQYKQSTFELFEINGRKVLSQQIKGKWGEVNTTLLNTGTYIYNIYNSEGLFESGKWVKR